MSGGVANPIFTVLQSPQFSAGEELSLFRAHTALPATPSSDSRDTLDVFGAPPRLDALTYERGPANSLLATRDPALARLMAQVESLPPNEIGKIKPRYVPSEDPRLCDRSQDTWVHRALSRWSLSAGILAAYAIGYEAVHRDWNEGMVTSLVGIGGLMSVFALERALPRRKDWALTWGEIPLDFMHNVFTTSLFNKAAMGALKLAIWAAGYAVLAAGGTTEDFVSAFDFYAQLIGPPTSSPWVNGFLATMAVLLLREIPLSAHHWSQHKSECGWLEHRQHHRWDKLNVTKGGSNHFRDSAAREAYGELLMIAFGVPAAYRFMGLLIQIVGGLFEHANYAADNPRWLKRVVNTPEAHTHHHAKTEEFGDKFDVNFGNVFVVYDWMTSLPEQALSFYAERNPDVVFDERFLSAMEWAKRENTYFVPEDRPVPYDVGIKEGREIAPPGTPFLVQWAWDNIGPYAYMFPNAIKGANRRVQNWLEERQ